MTNRPGKSLALAAAIATATACATATPYQPYRPEMAGGVPSSIAYFVPPSAYLRTAK
jgi:hypothetical protein